MKNEPKLWQGLLPQLDENSHKYSRGHAVVFGGGAERSGAARLAAMAALRTGAGLVTIAVPKSAMQAYAAHLTAIMLKSIHDEFGAFIDDHRKNVALIGPGTGVGSHTQVMVLKLIEIGKHVVIDADALTSFKNEPETLFKAIAAKPDSKIILTPHEGEFERIFNIKGDRLEQAKQAAKLSGAVVLLKGNKTVIASPDGKTIINENAPPNLATAGSGDVLAGIITGFIAQGMPAYEAAAASAWVHGHAAGSFNNPPAGKFGYGLISEDLLYLIPNSLDQIYNR